MLCEYCTQEKTRRFCPKCGISLAGALSRSVSLSLQISHNNSHLVYRNKGLEKIAAKYYA